MVMTNQEIFDTVYQHLVKQGEQAHKPGYGCKYRTESGTMCAVGCLIPNEVYDEVYEGNTVASMDSTFWEDMSDIIDKDTSFYLLTDLQRLHDSSSSWDDDGMSPGGHERMKSIARNHFLEYNKPVNTIVVEVD